MDSKLILMTHSRIPEMEIHTKKNINLNNSIQILTTIKTEMYYLKNTMIMKDRLYFQTKIRLTINTMMIAIIRQSMIY
jgi:hypothetical protein